MKSARQDSNDGELLFSKYIGYKAKRQRVKWDPRRVQLYPLHPPGYGPTPKCQSKAEGRNVWQCNVTRSRNEAVTVV